MEADCLFIGGPKDGHRITLPRDQECSRVRAEKSFGMTTALYRRLDLVGGYRVYYHETMLPDDVMKALINRYPSPNPAP